MSGARSQVIAHIRGNKVIHDEKLNCIVAPSMILQTRTLHHSYDFIYSSVLDNVDTPGGCCWIIPGGVGRQVAAADTTSVVGT